MGKWLGCLLLLVAAVASPAHAAWREARSKHFVIYSEQSEKGLKEFAEQLERFDKGLRVLFNVQDNQVSHASRVTVFILPNISAVRKAAGLTSSSNVAGFYRDWPTGPAAFVPRGTGAGEAFGFDSVTVLQHEYAHHFLFQNFDFVVPAWLSEGFAEFASTADRQSDGSLGLGLPAQHRAYALLMLNALPIEKLLDPKGKRSADETARFYGRSWLLCHYLLTDAGRQGQLPAYLQQINSGKSALDAARAAFGDLNKLDKDLDAYLNRIRSKMSAFRLPLQLLPISPVTVRELGPGEAAMMNVRIESEAGVNRDEAPRVVEMARKAAAPYPNDAAVQTALAEAEFDARNYAEAEAAADRAIAADPKAIDAVTFKGTARMRQAVEAGKHDPATWSEVRKWLLAANRLDPEDPEPLTYFFLSYLRQGIPPTANAVDAAVRSLELAPQNVELRMMLVQYFLRNGKAAEARAALMRLAAAPHGGPLRDMAADMIASIESGGAEAALGVLASRRASLPAGEGPPDGGN